METARFARQALLAPYPATTIERWSASSQRCCSSTSSISTELAQRRRPRGRPPAGEPFFDQVSHCIVTHGGTVEKFAGDAVMAAFGVPLAHEDDAERAVRAALATIDRVRELGLEARIGIESGEVVADDSDSTFATGEAVNLAARLQQARRAERDPRRPRARAASCAAASSSRRSAPLELRGWREPVAALARHLRHRPGEPVTGLSAPLVGRESELELLENTYERAVRDGRARSSRSTATPASARAGSRASSSRGSRARPCSRALPPVRRGRHLLAARGDGEGVVGHQRRRPARRRTARSCAPAARTKRSPTCSASPSACSRPSRASARSRTSPGPPARGPSSSRRRSRSSSSSRTCTGARSRCSS